jgi:hypothetical protein
MSRIWRENSLSITMFALFLFAIVGQSIAGQRSFNDERQEHGQAEVGYFEYLGSGHFVESVFENWESEFLQMGLYVLLTAYLVQKGSPESKKLDEKNTQDEDPEKARKDPSAPWPVRQGGVVSKLYEHSLATTLLTLFVVSFALHAAGGATEYSREQLTHGAEPVSVFGYLATSQLWFESFQNWQSEFLSIGVLAVLAIFLRQKGSPESKPVAAPHGKTGDA